MKKTESIFNFRLIALSFAAVSLIFLASCGDDEPKKEPDPTMTLLEIINTTPGLDSLSKYAGLYPDIVGALGDPTGDRTVFAPNNAAFINLLATPGFPPDISFVNPDIIKGVLFYHLSNTRYETSDLTEGTSISSMQGESIGITISNGTPSLVTGSTSTSTGVLDQIKATNGVIHTTAFVLIPPSVGQQLTPLLGTNGGSILLSATFTHLAAGITAADTYAATNQLPAILPVLIGSDKNTIFAPVNQVFEAAAAEAGVPVADYLAGITPQQWYFIIRNHIVMGDVASSSITTGVPMTTIFTMDGTNFGMLLPFVDATGAINPEAAGRIYLDGNGDVDLTDPTTFGGFDAYIALPDAAENQNGRVHAIAGVLSPL